MTATWVPEVTFGGRLLLLRHSLGLTIDEIATKCDINRATWSTWENGRSPRNMAEVVNKIYRATGADRDWLMWGVASEGKGALLESAGQARLFSMAA